MRHTASTILRHTVRRCRGLAVAAVVAAAAAVAPLPALSAQAIKLTGDQQEAVDRVTDYFNKHQNLKGEFVQVGPKGHISEGKFFLSRPGKLRFEYSPPNPFLVVADGTYVIIHDRRLKTADHIPISATPLRLVLAEHVDILAAAKILDVTEDDGFLSLTLEDKNQLVPGQLTLVFDKTNFSLDQWVIIDGQGNRTTISVRKIEPGVPADPALFTVSLPREIELGHR